MNEAPQIVGLIGGVDLTRRQAIDLAHVTVDRLLRTRYVVHRHGDFLVLLPEGLRPGDLIVHMAE